MAETITKKSKRKSNENRYSGTDTVPWRVVEANGKSPLKNKDGGDETFAGFASANAAAQRFTHETGSWAGAVRV